MRTSKRREPQGPDRLSELPDSVIFHILWFVPMVDVMRTSVLSKRWRNLCNITPYLNFVATELKHYDSGHTEMDCYTNKFRTRVNRGLMLWNGERILKFKVDSSDCLDKLIFDDIDTWVLFAKKNKVEELYLHFHYESISSVVAGVDSSFDEEGYVYCVPAFLGSCSCLKELSFRQCNLCIYRDVQWNQLKSLTISENFDITEHMVNLILSGSPLLEVFVLSFADRGDSLSIQSGSLKELSIYKFVFSRYHIPDYIAPNEKLVMSTELKIMAPNLESLEIKGIPYGKCLLIDVSSLTHATLGFYGLHFLNEPVYEYLEDASTTIDFLGEKYGRTLPNIQHVEHVTLYYSCIKVLGAMKKQCIQSSFPNVKSLQIGYCFNDYEQLGVLLESFPQLKRLVIQAREEDEHYDERDSLSLKFDSKSYLKFCESILPNSFLLQLRTVEVTWAEGDNIFPFIEIVLKYARKLEKIVFRVKGTGVHPPPSKSLFQASQKLLRMPRSSPNCTIDIIPYVAES